MEYKLLRQQIFDTKEDVYCIIDGASVSGLLAKLEEYGPKSTCLFRGELSFDLAETAPYLVKLEEKNHFSDWIIEKNTNKPCCIYAYSDTDFFTLRKHFRSLLKAKSPEGKNLYFRYYDPRVMKTYLPTCNAKDSDLFFENINTYLIMAQNKASFTRFKNLYRIDSEIMGKLSSYD